MVGEDDFIFYDAAFFAVREGKTIFFDGVEWFELVIAGHIEVFGGIIDRNAPKNGGAEWEVEHIDR